MKLMFDHNLSHRLVERLADLYPGSVHVRDVNLHEADDRTVWDYARSENFVIASKDEDFHQLAFLHGPPPKVVWLRLGNCSTTDIESALREHRSNLESFGADEESAFLVIGSDTH